jgi:hypothetical protein
MKRRLSLITALLVLGSLVSRAGFSGEITAERSSKGVVIKIDGKLFTEYLVQSGNKPILWPIMGPTDKPMTRGFPMVKPRGEAHDHPHQRSLWFTHGDVNHVNFWDEPSFGKAAAIKHVKFVKVASGQPAIIVTQNNWLGKDGKRICEDERTFRFDTDGDARWIDVDITIKATDGPVTFGDSKEGTFAVRVAQTLCVDAKKGGKIVNSHQQVDAAAWAQRAPWVDYHGPIDGQTVGIAIFNHPSSFRYPTYWHVRTYGLFSANPFGLTEFTGGKLKDGAYTIPVGKTMNLRYRVFLHRGDEQEGKVAEAFTVYSQEVR